MLSVLPIYNRMIPGAWSTTVSGEEVAVREAAFCGCIFLKGREFGMVLKRSSLRLHTAMEI